MNRAHMKTPFILTCACAAALVFPLSSCSTQNSSTAGYDTAEPALSLIHISEPTRRS